MEIRELLAREEIRAALSRYCRGVDRGDRAMILSAYHPDAHDEHGRYKGGPVGFADHVIGQFDAAPDVGQHHITNVLIELDGDLARVESYFFALNPRVEGGGHDLVAGRYLDVFERRDEWRIRHRVVVIDVSRDDLAGKPWPPGRFIAGARHENDPSVAFFSGRWPELETLV